MCSRILCARTGGLIRADGVEPSSAGKDRASFEARLAREVSIMPRSKEHLIEGSHVICLPDTIIGEQEPLSREPRPLPRRNHTPGASLYS